MKSGTFYGIGIGPGDPDLLTLKAVKILSQCPYVFVPRARDKADSLALEIAQPHLSPDAVIHEMTFPMARDPEVLRKSWTQAASQVAEVLTRGEDCCFLTLGDCLLFSTYIYLLRHLREICPDVQTFTIPGINSYSAVAAITQVPLGEGKQVLTVVPVAPDMQTVRQALAGDGPVVLMKVGRHLEPILSELETSGRIDQSVFVAHATQPQQHVELDLRQLRDKPKEVGYLSTIIVEARAGTVPVNQKEAVAPSKESLS